MRNIFAISILIAVLSFAYLEASAQTTAPFGTPPIESGGNTQSGGSTRSGGAIRSGGSVPGGGDVQTGGDIETRDIIEAGDSIDAGGEAGSVFVLPETQPNTGELSAPQPDVSTPDDNGLIPCKGTEADPCDFNDLVTLANNIIEFLILLSLPVAAVGFAVAGFKILTSQGDPGKIKEGKELLMKIGKGFIIILAAFLVVYTIMNTFVLPSGEGGPIDLLERIRN